MKNVLNRNREFLLQTYNHLYKIHYSDPKGMCFYCGDFATDLDHSPPISEFELTKPKWFKDSKIPLVKVCSCRDCNALLGAKRLFTVFERTQYLDKRLMDKFDKQMSLWSTNEIRQMSPMFKRMIRERKKQSKHLHERAIHAQWRMLQRESFPTFAEHDYD